MDVICISLGGSIVSRKDGINVSYVRKLSSLLREFSKKHKFIILVGGGYANSLYVNSTRSSITNHSILDQIGIAITRINALILKDLLPTDMNVYPNVATTIEEIKMAVGTHDIVVLGGLMPGITTDACTVLACEVTNSKVMINVSSEAYVYDKHPSEKGARKLPNITHDQLIALAYKYDARSARSHFIFDLVGSKLAKRAGLPIKFVNDDMQQLKFAIEGKKFDGTLVK